VTLVCVGGGSAARTALPGFVDCPGHAPLVRPTSITLACANRSFTVQKLKWRYWTEISAAGTGRGYVNDCVPNCAGGHVTSYAVALRLFLPKTCKTGPVEFTRLTYQFVAAMPVKGVRIATSKRGCS
jgi:hypothetical protein